MSTVVAVKMKRNKQMKYISLSRLSGIKWNLLRLMICLAFLFVSLLYFNFLKLEELNWMQFGCR